MAWFLLGTGSLTLTSAGVKGLLFPGKEAETLHSESESWERGSNHLFGCFLIMFGFPECSAFTFMRAAWLLTAAQTRGFPPAAWNSRPAEPAERKAGAASPQHTQTAVGPELGLQRWGTALPRSCLS